MSLQTFSDAVSPRELKAFEHKLSLKALLHKIFDRSGPDQRSRQNGAECKDIRLQFRTRAAADAVKTYRGACIRGVKKKVCEFVKENKEAAWAE